jgi:arginyl-tRNA synthetase
LRKTGNASRKPDWKDLERAERDLLFRIYSYPYAIEDSVRGLKPDSVATYLLELTRSYNDFYSECPVLNAEEGKRERRIEILKMYRNVVKDATDLLGIKILEEM